MDNFQEAINSYKKVIAEPETDERLKTSVYYSIAQLYFAVEDYKNAARFLETWMKESAIVGADGKVLLAQAYYQLNRKTEALKFVNEAIDEWQKKGNIYNLLPRNRVEQSNSKRWSSDVRPFRVRQSLSYSY